MGGRILKENGYRIFWFSKDHNVSAFQAPEIWPSNGVVQLSGVDQLCQRPCHYWKSMHSGLRKLVGIFLLLWAVMDLSVPGLCETDAPDFGALQTTAASAAPSINQQQQSQTSLEDDCFCCCAHVLLPAR